MSLTPIPSCVFGPFAPSVRRYDEAACAEEGIINFDLFVLRDFRIPERARRLLGLALPLTPGTRSYGRRHVAASFGRLA